MDVREGICCTRGVCSAKRDEVGPKIAEVEREQVGDPGGADDSFFPPKVTDLKVRGYVRVTITTAILVQVFFNAPLLHSIASNPRVPWRSPHCI